MPHRPGPVTLLRVPESQASEVGPGWMRIKHPKSRYGFVRWAKENF